MDLLDIVTSKLFKKVTLHKVGVLKRNLILYVSVNQYFITSSAYISKKKKKKKLDVYCDVKKSGAVSGLTYIRL